MGNIFVEIRIPTKVGPVKAYADIRISLPDGILELNGFSVIVQDGKPAWVGFPAKAGNVNGKFFPVVNADGNLRERITTAILDAYRDTER